MSETAGIRTAERYAYQSLHWGFPIVPLVGLVALTGPTPTEWVLGWVATLAVAAWAALVTLHTGMRTAGDLGPSPWDRWFRTARPRAWLVAWLVTAAAAMILTPPAGGLLSGRLGAVDGGLDRLLSGLLLGLIPGLLALPALVLTRRRWVAYALAAVLAGVGLVNTARRGDVAEFFSHFYLVESIALMAVGFSSMFLTLLRAMAQLDRARRDSARLAVAEERLRFSRDLHDVFGRTLSAVALKAELAAAQAERGRPEAAGTMREVQRIAVGAAEEVRSVVRGYRAADLATELAGARALLEAAGVAVTTDLAPGELPGAVRRTFAWVVREAATNVLRHAEASRVSFVLQADAAGATLAVRNDRPRPAEGVRGSGLAGLTERLAEVGGTLATETGGGWFTVRAHVDAAALARLAEAEGGVA